MPTTDRDHPFTRKSAHGSKYECTALFSEISLAAMVCGGQRPISARAADKVSFSTPP